MQQRVRRRAATSAATHRSVLDHLNVEHLLHHPNCSAAAEHGLDVRPEAEHFGHLGDIVRVVDRE